jgi:hypothetical protein
MITRSASRTVVFARPFALSAMDRMLPAGSYIVETDEELLQALSFPAYRRVATWLRVPARANSGTLDQVVNIDPAELELALARDAQPTGAADEGPAGAAAEALPTLIARVKEA